MKRLVVCVLALFLSFPAQCVFVLAAPIVQDAELQYPLLNKDIASMVKAKIAPEVIVAKIKSSRCHFDTTPSVLAEMKQGGISNEVLMAMIEAPYGSPKPVAKPRPKPRQQEADEASETEDVGEGSFLLLPEAMEFTVTPTQEINSKQAVEGELVTFRVVNSVVVKGQKVIAGGAIARGTVTDVEKRGMLGKAGKLSIRIDSVRAVDGQKVRLRASKGREGGSNTGKVIALSLLVTPLFLLMRGNTARIKEGQMIQVFTDESKRVRIPVKTAQESDDSQQ